MQERQEKMLKDAKIPGMGVSITSSEGVTTAHGVGVTSAAAPEAVTKDTIFEAASLTKPVFAYLVIKLAQEKGIVFYNKLLRTSLNPKH